MATTETFRAYGFSAVGGPENQLFLDLPIPAPGPAELLVEVRAAGINPADWKSRSGGPGPVPTEFPAVLGREVSGVVRAIGQDVTGFAIGDEVFGSTAPGAGGYGEYSLLWAESSAKKPPQVSWTDAAALPVAVCTAYDGIVSLGLPEGTTLLVNGIGGGVGVAAAQLARNGGVAVVGTASEGKRELVESLGATLVGYGPGVAARVRELLPDGVDAVFDMVGGEALREVATLVKDPANLISIADKSLVKELGGRDVERRRTTAVYSEVIALVADGSLSPHVIDVRPLDEAPEALAAVETGHAMGKVVLRM
ncbi:MAG: NADP-dependent oxidoreductase [Pseudonocardia sp.]|uniref:NADP-dependent oxidoreductase n=1 Tax=unclassified Pseudonocardia TaxID=2619320 RepID=UPI00086B4D54|nr:MULTISPECIES: NADP-dependent oxidoreductase [unclassified Pseudonocardia]MBN9113279.1 NADP-dependent oxidoreductase [Pseudonocardia sp.]ODU19843.1 MAG: NADPH:quinone reductase [Pseudonocardia sp. SCN 72-51]ODV00870.1 MAG: NADPH:quinone reductase [Pseudonocardia sp. SCN 73-27]